MGISFPAPGFPLYGLADDWDGPRWLDFIEGRSGDPTTGVWLGHGRSPSPNAEEPWARVATLPRDRDRVREVAFAAMFALVNATMPAPSERPDDYQRRIVDFARREADRHLEWAAVTWTVDERAVAARVFTLAGAWAGFTTALPKVDVVVVGSGIEPGTLALAEVVDSSAYHFDVEQLIAFPEVVERSRALALGAIERDEHSWWPAHPDHAWATSSFPDG